MKTGVDQDQDAKKSPIVRILTQRELTTRIVGIAQ
jgi:hypothetical protein